MMDQLPDTILSAEDLRMIILEVEAYSRWFAAGSVKQRVAGKRAAVAEPPSLSPTAISLVKKAGQPGSDALDTLVAALRSVLDSAPTMTITLAAPPPLALKRSLASWCRANISTQILVEFRFSSYLLGGMVVQYGSRIYDWSFRRRILGSRENFAEILSRV